jgi:hypothetical protein
MGRTNTERWPLYDVTRGTNKRLKNPKFGQPVWSKHKELQGSCPSGACVAQCGTVLAPILSIWLVSSHAKVLSPCFVRHAARPQPLAPPELSPTLDLLQNHQSFTLNIVLICAFVAGNSFYRLFKPQIGSCHAMRGGRTSLRWHRYKMPQEILVPDYSQSLATLYERTNNSPIPPSFVYHASHRPFLDVSLRLFLHITCLSNRNIQHHRKGIHI